jgi:leucyl aminopeptidase
VTLPCFVKSAKAAVPITPLTPAGLTAWRSGQPPAVRRWIKETGFKAGHGAACLVADAKGGLARVLVGLGSGAGPLEPAIWAFGGLPAKLPDGRYSLDPEAEIDATEAAITARMAAPAMRWRW